MQLPGRVGQIASDLRVLAAITLTVSLALPLVMYQSSAWRKEAALNAAKLEYQAALKTLSAQAAERIKSWSEAKKHMPLPETGAQAPGNNADRTTQMDVNIENQHMSRTEADRVLEGLAQNTDGLFVPDAFLIRGVKPGDGIYARNTADDLPDSVAMTIKGEFVSRDFK